MAKLKRLTVFALLCSLLALSLAPQAAASERTGSAAVTAWKKDSSDASMMSAMLAGDAILEETDGKVYATLTFQTATIMLIKVKGTQVDNIKTLDSASRAFDVEPISRDESAGTYTFRAYLPEFEQNNIKMQLDSGIMTMTQTMRLHFEEIRWAEPVTTAAASTAMTTQTTTLPSTEPLPVSESTSETMTSLEAEPAPVTEIRSETQSETQPASAEESSSGSPVIYIIISAGAISLAGTVLFIKRKGRKPA